MVVEVDPARQRLDVVVVEEVVEVDSCGELLRRDVFHQRLRIGRQTVDAVELDGDGRGRCGDRGRGHWCDAPSF
jgi:hypothetical protein